MRLVIFLIMAFCLSGFVVADDFQNCGGDDCDSRYRQVEMKVNELIVNAVLHRDGGVTYSSRLGLSNELVEEDVKEGYAKAFFTLPLPRNSTISSQISVSEVITNTRFTKVYFFENNCHNQFIFNRAKNSVDVCFEPRNQIILNVVANILPDRDYFQTESCREENSISNTMYVVVAPTNYSYYMEVTAVGDDNVKVSKIDNGACTAKNESENISNMIAYFKENGIVCSGTVFPYDKPIEFGLITSGKDYASINEQKDKNMEELQKKNIQASIDSSKNTKWNTWLTVILVCATIGYAYVAHRTWKEMERSNVPLVSAKLEPLGTSAVVLKIINIGNSAARNIRLTYSVKPAGNTGEWKYHMLQKGDYARILIKGVDGNSYPIQTFVTQFSKIVIKSKFEDIHKNKKADNFEIDLKDFKYSMDHNIWLIDTTIKEDIEQIAHKIKDISDILKNSNIKIDVKDMKLDVQRLKKEVEAFEDLNVRRKKVLKKMAAK